ncbi:uncharacterized protein [Prorops nasuta]|uniref:uncharacterized protein n=1 Tax=Prorops nasuta TaxID=863751 RepID=UPI0034CD0FF6
MVPTFVDFQGFRLKDNSFIVKEFAVLRDKKVFHILFSPPFPYSWLNEAEIKQANWLYYNHHGLNWTDGYSPYYRYKDVIRKYVINEEEQQEIFVKGLEKRNWLSGISDYTISNADECEWGDFKLKDSKDKLDLSMCMNHEGLCALKNVYFMKYVSWMKCFTHSTIIGLESIFLFSHFSHQFYILKMYTELRKKFSLIKTEHEYSTWVRECRDRIQELRNDNRNASVGTRQKHFAEIANIKCLLLRASKDKSSIKFGSGSHNAGELIWEELDSAFNSRICSGMVINSSYIEPRSFLLDAEEIVYTRVNQVFDSVNSVKINCVFNGQFVSKDISDDKHVCTKNSVLYKTDNFKEWYRLNIVEILLKELSEFQERDSGWALEKILSLIVNINHYNPLHAGCRIELPAAILHKKAVINIDNEDSACFAWAVTVALFPAIPPAKSYRISSYPHYRSVLDVGSITFPTTLKQIPKFEVDNDISVNVFTMEEVEEEHDCKAKVNIVPLQITKMKRSRHVNLLLITDDQGTAHFLCIRNLPRLISSQISKREHSAHICDR